MISSFSLRADREVAEPHRAGGRQQREDRLDRVADARRGSARRDRCDLGRRRREQPRTRGGEERVERHPLQRIGRERSERLLRAGAAGDRAARVGEARVQHLRRVLERLAVEEPREQQVALLEAARAPRRARCRRGPAAAGAPSAPRASPRSAGTRWPTRDRPAASARPRRERVDDANERDLPEVDLFLEDQVQQEVERAFEDRRRDLVGHARQGIQPGRAVDAPSPTPRKRPGRTALFAGNVRRRDTCVLGNPADRRHAPRQLHRGRAPLGRQPARGRLRRPRATTTRSSASSTCTR